MAAIALIDVRVGHAHAHAHARVLLDRRHRCGQSVAVVRIAPAQLGSDDPVVAVGRRDGHLLAKLVPLVRLPLADAHHLRLVQAGELLAVGPLLGVQTFAQGEQFGQRLVRFVEGVLQIMQADQQANRLGRRAEVRAVTVSQCRLETVSVDLVRQDEQRMAVVEQLLELRPKQIELTGFRSRFGLHADLKLQASDPTRYDSL